MFINVTEITKLFPEGTCNSLYACNRPIVSWQKKNDRFELSVRTRNGRGVDIFDVSDNYTIELSEVAMPTYLGGSGKELKETGYGTSFNLEQEKMVHTIESVKEQLPKVPVKVGKQIIICNISGRRNRFATVWTASNIDGWEFSWQAIVDALNSKRPLSV